MPKDYATAASKGDPLMAFWTVATIGYLYTITGSQFLLPIIITSTFTASVGYYELSQLKERVQSTANKYSKSRWRNKSRQEIFTRMLGDVFDARIFTAGLTIAAINLLLGIVIYLFTGYYIFTGSTDQILLFFFLIPLIWLSTLSWRLIKLTGA